MRTVGKYEILREVGRGGMGTVYLGRQIDLDRLVAVKELNAFHASDPAFAARFLRESRVAGSLSHPNIVVVHDYFEADKTPYITMEYLERGSLRPFVGRLDLSQIFGVLEETLAGLAHAETKRIVHRDLKPENLMLTSDGRVKIADFGIAKALDQTGTSHLLTATGATVGTPSYMAPEQALAKDVGPRTDLYSLGIIAYELLCGRLPFVDATTPVAMLLRQVNDPVPPPRDVNPDLDPELAEWIERMLAKEPGLRPPGATEAWHQLEEVALRLLGPRWRRGARIVDEPLEAPPLTPPPHPAAPAAEGAGASEEYASFRWPQPVRPDAETPEPAAAVDMATPPHVGPPAETPRAEPAPAAPAATPRRESPPPSGVEPSAATPGADAAPLASTAGEAATAAPSRQAPGSAAPPAVTQRDRGAGAALRRMPVWAVLVAVAAIVVGAVLLTGGGEPSTEPPPRAQVAARVIIPAPFGVGVGASGVWVTNRQERTVVRVDPETNRVSGEAIRVGATPVDVAVGERVWVVNEDGGTVSVIDPAAGSTVGEPVRVGPRPKAVAVDGDTVWVARSDGTVVRIDARTAELRGDPIAVGDGSNGIAAGAGAIWVANYTDGSVSRIDPATGELAAPAIRTGRGTNEVAIAGRLVWATNYQAGTVVGIDPVTNSVVRRVELAATCVAGTPEYLWAAVGNQVQRLDPANGRRIGRPVEVGGNENCVRALDADAWVAVEGRDELVRLRP